MSERAMTITGLRLVTGDSIRVLDRIPYGDPGKMFQVSDILEVDSPNMPGFLVELEPDVGEDRFARVLFVPVSAVLLTEEERRVNL